MHYKNGRLAKAGDKVISLQNQVLGILHTVNGSATSCNGRIATTTPHDPYVTISECLHVDDVASAEIPDSTAVAPALAVVQEPLRSAPTTL